MMVRVAAEEDKRWEDGRVSGAVYHGEAAHLDLLNKVPRALEIGVGMPPAAVAVPTAAIFTLGKTSLIQTCATSACFSSAVLLGVFGVQPPPRGHLAVVHEVRG